jgi:hypothetical protein
MTTPYQRKIHHSIAKEAESMRAEHAANKSFCLSDYAELVALYFYARAERLRSEARRRIVGPGFNYQGKRYGWKPVVNGDGTKRLQVLDWHSGEVLIDGFKGVHREQPPSA